jgi:anti-sigma B factor antagonist
MTASSAKMLVSIGDQCACVTIAGKVDFTSSVDFKILFEQLWKKGCTYFVLDLSDCTLMDSTFLGVLASCGLKTNETQQEKVVRTLDLYNPSERIFELLENLGVMRLFKISHGDIAQCRQGEVSEVAASNPTREEVTRTCLEAHQLLMKINPANVPKFKDVATYLAEELKKPKTGAPMHKPE